MAHFANYDSKVRLVVGDHHVKTPNRQLKEIGEQKQMRPHWFPRHITLLAFHG